MKRGRVKEMLFDDLVESVKEAGRIHRGEIPPSRKFVFEAMDIKAIRKRLSKSQIEELEDRMLSEKAKAALDIEFTSLAEKAFRKLPKNVQKIAKAR